MLPSEITDLNLSAEFLPQRNADERPAIRVADALVFAYMTEDDCGNIILRVTIDLDDVEEPHSGIQVAIGDAVVYDA